MKKLLFISLVALAVFSMERASAQSCLIAHFPLDGDGTDISPTGNDGTVNGAVAGSDRFGNANEALSFDGVNDNVTFDPNPYLLDEYTYSVWANVFTLPFSQGYAGILSIGNFGQDQVIILGNNSGPGHIGWGAGGYDENGAAISVYLGSLPATAQWYHLALTRDDSLFRFYVNGNLVGTFPHSGLGAGYAGTPLGAIGSRSQSNQYFNGLIDDVMIFRCALSEAEILNLANGGYTGTYANVVSGMAYYDVDSNGIRDTSDWPMANVEVSINAGSASAFTGQDGSYYFYTDSGSLQVEAVTPENFAQSSLPAVYNLSLSTGSAADSNDFGFKVTNIIYDLKVSITSGPARPGFLTSHWIDYQNNGTVALNGTLTYTHDAELTFSSASVPLTTQNANIVTWDFSNLFPGEQRSIRVFLQVPADISLLGETLASQAVITPNSNDASPKDNIDETFQVVTGSFDPNDKLVSPGDPVAAEQMLTYTIRFQNTGTDTAFRVIIRDTLDDHLDLATFSPISTSHPAHLQMDGKFVMWTFDNILLPDSGRNEPGSHGFVKFSISLNDNVPLQAVVQNTASIYFDFNPPVVTNTVESRLEVAVAIKDPAALTSLVSPNPVSSTLVIHLNRHISDGRLLIKDISGRELKRYDGIAGEKIIQRLGDMDNGTYIYQITSGNAWITNGKFVVAR